MNKKIAFNNSGYVNSDGNITNIIENLSTSTNNAIINGLLRRGIGHIYQFNSSSVRLDERYPVADATIMSLIKKDDALPPSLLLKYGDSALCYLENDTVYLNDMDIVFVRGDDIEKNSNIISIYDHVNGPVFINSPKGTLSTKDKFEIKERAELFDIRIPYTINATKFDDMLYALRDMPGEFVVIKSRYGFGGKEVFRVTDDTSEDELMEIFKGCGGEVLVQEFKDIVQHGDLRLNVFDGEILGGGAILRKAGKGRCQTNIDLGGYKSSCPLDDEIIEVVRKVCEAYPDVRLHGIDLFLDATFNEINAFPSTIGYTEEFFGVKAEDIILDGLFETNEDYHVREKKP